MSQTIKLMLSVLIISFLTSCATSIKPGELASVKTIGVINKFPEYPSYSKVSFNAFDYSHSFINDESVNKTLSDKTIAYLAAKGFKVQLIEDSERNSYDMILEITPREVYQVSETYGYGVQQRAINLGLSNPIKSYVSMYIDAYIQGRRIGSKFDHTEHTKIDIEDIRKDWDELSADKKKKIINSLNMNIDKTINILMPRIGIK